MKVTEEILEQLGGGKFAAMTGAKNFMSDGNTLRMSLPRNASKANRLYITLNAFDTYDMRFFRYTAARMNHTTYEFTQEKITEVYNISGVYADQLTEIFEQVTGMYTRLGGPGIFQ